MSQICLAQLDRDKVELLKTTICKGATDDELKLFVHACNHMQLDPFLKQIHAVKRYDSASKGMVMSIQVGIDGHRLVAERTGRYAPGPKPTFEYDTHGSLISATAYVKKQTSDGTWHIVEALAFYAEYVQTTKEGNPNSMWRTKAHTMLAKCAESLALKKCFPAELSGTYTDEEMGQADNAHAQMPPDPAISVEQAQQLDALLYEDAEGLKMLLSWAKVATLSEVTVSKFSTVLKACQRRAAAKAEQEMLLTDQTAKSEVVTI